VNQKNNLTQYQKMNKHLLVGICNGNVGTDSRRLERWHGGWDYGEKNAKGQSILEYMTAQDMALINTYFKKADQL
jgi:hypothetical protein